MEKPRDGDGDGAGEGGRAGGGADDSLAPVGSTTILARSPSIDSDDAALLPGTPLAEANAQNCILLDSLQPSVPEMECAMEAPTRSASVAPPSFVAGGACESVPLDEAEAEAEAAVRASGRDTDRVEARDDAQVTAPEMVPAVALAELRSAELASKDGLLLSHAVQTINKAGPEQEDQKLEEGLHTDLGAGISLPEISPSTGIRSSGHTSLHGTTSIRNSPETIPGNDVEPDVNVAEKEVKSVDVTVAYDSSDTIISKESVSLRRDTCLNDAGPSLNSLPGTDGAVEERVEFHSGFEVFEVENVERGTLDQLPEAESEKRKRLTDASTAGIAADSAPCDKISPEIEMEPAESPTCNAEKPIDMVVDDGMKFPEPSKISNSLHDEQPYSSTLCSVSDLEEPQGIRHEHMDISPRREVKAEKPQMNTRVDGGVNLSGSLNVHSKDEGTQSKELPCDNSNNSLSSFASLGVKGTEAERTEVNMVLDSGKPLKEHDDDDDDGAQAEKLPNDQTIGNDVDLEISQRIKPQIMDCLERDGKIQESVTCAVEQPLDTMVIDTMGLSESLDPHDSKVAVQSEEIHNCTLVSVANIGVSQIKESEETEIVSHTKLNVEKSLHFAVQQPLSMVVGGGIEVSDSSYDKGSQSEESPCAVRSRVADPHAIDIERIKPEEIEVKPNTHSDLNSIGDLRAEACPGKEVKVEEAMMGAVDQTPNSLVDPGVKLSTSFTPPDYDMVSQSEALGDKAIEIIPDREVKECASDQQPHLVDHRQLLPSELLNMHENEAGSQAQNIDARSDIFDTGVSHRIDNQFDDKENSDVVGDNLNDDFNTGSLQTRNLDIEQEVDEATGLDTASGLDTAFDITTIHMSENENEKHFPESILNTQDIQPHLQFSSEVADNKQCGSSGTSLCEGKMELDKVTDIGSDEHSLPKIEVDKGPDHDEGAELDANCGKGEFSVLENERDVELSECKSNPQDPEAEIYSELEPHEAVELDDNLDSHISENEREMDFPESNINDEDLQDDLGVSSELVSTEKQRRRKRGRKGGKKGTNNEEKQVHESDILEQQQSRKRGRRLSTKVTQKEEEDVCFVCCDGGKLILCDKRSCPKAYHLECTGRQSEFFQKKGQWFCGWHVCAQCSKSATMHCFTCPRAVCNNCIEEGNFHCITKNRGLCEGCYVMARMIEHNETVNADGTQVDFNDQETYEGLFNEYWQNVKLKHSLTSADLNKAGETNDDDDDDDDVLVDSGLNDDPEEAMEDEESDSSDSEDKALTTRQSRLSKRKRTNRSSAVETVGTSEGEEDEDNDEHETMPKKSRVRAPEFDGWASKELKELIQYMKEDPKKQLPLFGVKKLLWRYIDENNLTNPRRRGQIICDQRLQKIFGKKCVGRFEMMKLISLHVGTPVKNATSKVRETHSAENDTAEIYGGDENLAGKKKSRRRGDDKRLKADPSEYAAINVKNVNLIYLKRSILDELRNDPDLESKVVGAFVRIRVPSMVNKNDTCYRLVQVVGIKQIYDALDPEKVTDVILEILNLHKREEITADLVSNQDFLEEECQRLRQSVRCGLIKTMTVGELEERARGLREVKVKDWFENELLRLSHLRDRASEKGRKKELRECVEKLQLLSNPDEKQRQLHAPFDIDADPYMDPNFESEDEDLPPDDSPETGGAHNVQEKVSAVRTFDRGAGAGSTVKFQSHWEDGSFDAQDVQWKASGWSQKELGRNEKDSGHKDTVKQYMGGQAEGQMFGNEKSLFTVQAARSTWGDAALGGEKTSSWDGHGSAGRKEVRWGNNVERSGWADDASDMPDVDISINPLHSRMQPKPSSSVVPSVYSSVLPSDASTANAMAPADSEKEKIWCYMDPTKTVQGPFTMEQLRKWEKTNLFPLDLRIWRVSESQDASIFLTDALAGNFSKRPSQERLGQAQGHTSFPSIPTNALNNMLSAPPTQLSNTSGFSLGSGQASTAANGIPLGHVQGTNLHSLSSGPGHMQGTNLHVFPPQTAAGHAYPPGPPAPAAAAQAQQMHGFPPGPQASNVHSFPPPPPPPPPSQGSYAGYAQVPNQAPYMSNIPPRGPSVQGSAQALGAKSYPTAPMQAGQSATGYPQNTYMHVPSAPVGHTQQQQRARLSAPLNAPNTNAFPLNTNHAGGFGVANQGRDFRSAALPNRPGHDQHSVPNQTDDGAWGLGRRSMNSRVATQSPGFATSDNMDGSGQRHLGQGYDGRYATPKKDLFCRFFAKGLCRKGQDCDFKHE